MQFTSYLHFSGNCEEAFKFYEKCFGGKISMLMTYGEMPGGGQVSEGWNKKIVHARMAIGDQQLMGMDAPPERFLKPQGYNVNIGIDDPAEGKRIFEALSEKGNVVMPFGPTFWAVAFGMVVDRFGIPWMVNCEKPA